MYRFHVESGHRTDGLTLGVVEIVTLIVCVDDGEAPTVRDAVGDADAAPAQATESTDGSTRAATVKLNNQAKSTCRQIQLTQNVA